MNMVWCDKNCKYQADGCCRLDTAAAVISNNLSTGCCYYQPLEKTGTKKDGSQNRLP